LIAIPARIHNDPIGAGSAKTRLLISVAAKLHSPSIIAVAEVAA